MNVAKPGGPSGPSASPESSPSPAGGASGTSPAGPERKFSEVLSGNKGAQPAQAAQAHKPQATQFAVPILDDFGPSKVSPSGKSQFNPRVDRTEKVAQPSRMLEVAGEKVGGGPGGVSPPGVEAGGKQGWQKMADDTFKAETRIDTLIKQAQGGKSFNASELMALQVEVFRYSQTIEVISRTTDKLVGAVKQTLGTQV